MFTLKGIFAATYALALPAILLVTGCGSRTLEILQITSTSSMVVVSGTTQLTATEYTGLDRVKNVTDEASWSSSNPAVATVSSTGLVSGLAPGPVSVFAHVDGIEKSLALVVSSNEITKITVNPQGATLPVGTTEQYTASATYANGSDLNLSAVKWAVSPASVASVDAQGTLKGLAPGAFTLTASVGELSSVVQGTVSPATAVVLQIQPSALSLAKGTSEQLNAVAFFSDGTTQNVTRVVRWQSSDASSASISPAGLLAANATGGAQISAILPGSPSVAALTSTASVQVTSATLMSLALSPSSSRIAVNTSEPFTATATFSDGTTQDVTTATTFTSTNQAVATAAGTIVQGAGSGTTQVRGAFGGQQGVASLQVSSAKLTSMAVVPGSSLLCAGLKEQVGAMGTFSDGSTQDISNSVTWSSSNPSISSVTSQGTVTGITQGEAQVNASFEGQNTAASIGVTSGQITNIRVRPSSVHITPGAKQQFEARGFLANGVSLDISNFVTWSSANPSLATVDANGLASGIASGQAQITAQANIVATGASADAKPVAALHPAAVAPMQTISATASALVDPATLEQLVITQSSAVIAQNTSLQYIAVGVFSDGTRRVLTPSVQWQSLNPSLVTVNGGGLATGIAPGTTQLNASFQGVTSPTVSLQVTSATLQSLTMAPATLQVALGTVEPLTATGTFSDGSTQDLTASVMWSSNNALIATIDNTGAVEGVGVGEAQLTASFAGLMARGSLTVTSATVASITINPASANLPLQARTQFDATGTFSDGTIQDLSATVYWTSSQPKIAVVDPEYNVLTYAPGLSQVSAVFQSVTATSPVTVRNATLQSLNVSPASVTLASGGKQVFSATGMYSDGSTEDEGDNVLWSSSDPAVATIDVNGNAVAYGAGSAQITAQSLETFGTASITVSAPAGGANQSGSGSGLVSLAQLFITPTSARIAAGTSTVLRAIGIYSNGSREDLTNSVTWTSTNPAIASVSSAGVVSGLIAGQVTVQAQFGSTASQSTLIVTSATLASLAISPDVSDLADGTSEQFSALGMFSDGSQQDLTSEASWNTTNGAVVSVNALGVATGNSIGTAQLSTSFAGVSASPNTLQVTGATLQGLAITPLISQLALGTTEQFSVIGSFSDGSTQNLTTQANWSSLTSAAMVNPEGLVSTQGAGVAQISVSYEGMSATTPTFQVSTATLASLAISPSSGSIALGTSQQFTVTGTFSDGTTQNLTNELAVWRSSNPSVATINGSGLAQTGSTGPLQISASFGGQTATAVFSVSAANLTSLSISPSSASVALGTPQQFSAVGRFSDGTTENLTSQVNWLSSATYIAGINAQGLATGVGVGTAQISASMNGQNATASPMQVTAATLVSLAVSPSSASLMSGTTQQFTATATFSDGTTQDVTSQTLWQSTNTGVLSISAQGLGTANGAGSAAISATYGGQSYTTSAIQVSPATLVSIAITPGTPTLTAGATQQFTAVGTFTDGSTEDLTALVTWSSSNSELLSITTGGLANAYTTTSAVPVTLTAISGTVSSTATATVTPAPVPTPTLVSVAIVPTSARIAAGTQQHLMLRGGYSDGSMQDLSAMAVWSSSAPAIATVDATGLASAVSQGTAVVTAQVAGQQAQSTLVITPAMLVSMAIQPSIDTLASGNSQQFKLIGTFSDGSTQDLTDQAVWASSNPSVASVNATGLLASVTPGIDQLYATYGELNASTGSVTVTAATLVSLAISPNTTSFPSGTSLQFTVVGTYSDGTTQDLTSQASWQSSNPAAIGINSAGLANAAGTGLVTITANYSGLSAVTGTVQATPATLVSLAITPQSASLATGTTTQFTATGTFSDGSTQDLTSQVVWSSTMPTMLSIDATGLAQGGGLGPTQISATLDGTTASTQTVQVTPAALVTISITPSTANLAKGTTQQFNAIGTFSDGSTQDLTSSVSWSSNDTDVLSIDANGLATGLGTGSAQISASSMQITSSLPAVQVTPATLVSIALSPNAASIALGTTVQFTATGTFSDGSTQMLSSGVNWGSSDGTVVSIGNGGLASGVGIGSAQISVSYGNQTAMTSSFQVTAATLVSIAVTPGSLSIHSGSVQPFTAIGTFSDGSTQDLSSTVTWTSTDIAVATIASGGLASSLAPGTTTIQAQSGASPNTITGSANLTVAAAMLISVAVTPTSASIALGTTQQFHLTGTFSDSTTQDLTAQASWSSSAPSVSNVSSTGSATALAVGTSTVQVQYGGFTSTGALSVTPATLVSLAIAPSSASIALGSSQQLQAIGTYSDGTTQNLSDTVNWTSSSPGVAAVSQTGLVSSTGTGTDTISVSISISGHNATGTLTVTPAILVALSITPASASIALGTTEQFHSIGTYSDGSTQDLTGQASWQSSNASIVTINAGGLAASVAPGAAQLTASFGGQSASTAAFQVTPATLVSLALSPTSASIAKGTTQQFQVTGTFSDTSTQDLTNLVVLTSGDPTVATISAGGLASGVGIGATQISANYQGQATSTNSFVVTAATLTSLSITPAGASIAAGTTQQFTAIGNFSDGSTQDVSSQTTWVSSDPTVVTINGAGTATGAGIGTAQIAASYQGQNATAAQLSVTAATLVSLSIAPGNASVAKGTTQQFTATGTFSDSSLEDLTSQVSWSPSDSTLATISDTGVATGVGVGTLQVTASYQGQFAPAVALSVTAATLSSISISPTSASITKGTTQQFAATGTYSDGSTQDISSAVTWSSSSPSVSTINGLGLGTSVGVGLTSILAAYQGQVAPAAMLSVTAPMLESISVTPTSSTIHEGGTQQLSATGTFSDGSTQDLTSSVTWSSSNTGAATVSTSGLASGVGQGSTTVQAQSGSVSGSSNLTVTGAIVVSIAVTPTSASIALGTTQNYHAIGIFSDGTTQDLSSQVTWSSSAVSIASISNTGLASGAGTGAATLEASYGSLTSTASLSVTPAVLVGLAISPTSASAALGTSQQFHAIGTYSNGSTQDISSSVLWSSSSPSVANINQAGLVITSGTGSTTLSASLGAQTASGNLLVDPASLVGISISPASASIALGTTQQFSASGSYSDGSTQDLSSQVAWQSSDTAVININSSGLATSASLGSATVTASFGGQSASTTAVQVSPATLVSLALSPTSASIANGTTQQLRATGTYSDGSTQDLTGTVIWVSANPAVATVSASGLAAAVGPGSTQIGATYQGQTANGGSFTVTPATLSSISITPTSASLAKGTTQQFTATGLFSDNSTEDLTNAVSWQSSDATIATISSSGVAVGVGVGTAQITASYQGQNSSASTLAVTAATLSSVSITPGSASIAQGTSQQFTAIGTFSDNSAQDLTSLVTWQSSSPSVAAIINTGLATGVAIGSVQITASYQGQSASAASLAVTAASLNALTIAPAVVSIAKGTSQQFTVTGTYSDGSMQDLTNVVTWNSSSPSVATISASGAAMGAGVGMTSISASYQGQNGTAASLNVTAATLVSISITPATPSIAAGTSQQFTAIGTYSDGTMQNLSSSVIWSSSDPSVATINAGQATGLATGASQISASYAGQSATPTTLNVTPATLVSLTLTPASLTIAKGSAMPLQATASFSDGSTQNVTAGASWTYTSAEIASVNATGSVLGLTTGSTQITASYLGMLSNSIALTVTPATMVSITVTPALTTLAAGSTQQLQAIGTYSDGSSQNVTLTATWSSSSAAASVNASGLATGASAGAATIQAQIGSLTGSASFVVSAADIVSVAVTPANVQVPAGTTQQYTATATYSDGSQQTLANQVTWSVQPSGAATISSSGLLSAALAGAYTVAASTGSTQATVSGMVIAPVLISLTLTPSAPSIAKGTTQQLQAIGTYSDGSTQNLTTSVQWQSSATVIATVSSIGLVSGISSGNAQIWASLGSTSTLVTLTVSPATLVSLAISPTVASVASGTGQQFHAIGTLSDGSTQDLTTAVTWSSSTGSVATVNNAGLASSLGVGISTIGAHSGAVSATAALTVTQATAVSISLTPNTVSFPAGDSAQLIASATFTDGSSQNVTSSAVYTSSNTSIFKVNAAGQLQAIAAGTASLSAVVGSASTSITVTVTNAVLTSIAVTPAQVSLAAGTAQQMVATGSFSDGSTSVLTNVVTWSSSNPHLAAVSITGDLTSVAVGAVTVTAMDNGVSGTSSITITPATVVAVTVGPATSTLAAGQSEQFSATATLSDGTQQSVTSSANWSVGTPSVALVSNASGTQGLVTTGVSGSTTVSASVGSISGSAQLNVQPATLVSIAITPSASSLALGATAQLTATGTYSDGSTENLSASVQWFSADSAIADVSTSGLITGTGEGSTTVEATLGAVSSSSATVSVTAAVLTSISISPAAPALALGLSQQLSATGTYSDGSTANITSQVHWTSSNTSVAPVSSTGLVSTAATGSAEVTASLNGVSQQTLVTVGGAVLESISIQGNGGSSSFALGLSLQLVAIGTYSNGTTQTLTSSVTWSSANPSTGVVSASGLATGLTTGTLIARATINGITGSAAISVTAAVLESITISPANDTIVNVAGASVAYTATGHFSDGSTQALTGAHWSITSGLSLGTISSAGVFSPLGLGVGTITATYNYIIGSTSFTVVSAL